MIPGLMQTYPLLISDILRFAATAHPRREIVSRLIEEPIWRYDYAGLARRAERLAGALAALGVKSGDRVGTLGWNTHRHLELFYAVPGMGAVLHTVNPRLFDDQILYILNHAETSVLFVDLNLLGLYERLASRLPHVRTVVLMAAEGAAPQSTVPLLNFEHLLRQADEGFDWPVLDENAGAILCYTSGTTGDPKGVLYSHRSIVLHALAAGLSGALGVSAFDVIMPCSAMFHATAWSLPFVAPINGAKLVLPADLMDPASLCELIDSEGVTVSGGVPTIWTAFIQHLKAEDRAAGTLRLLIIGGSALPKSMAQTLKADFAIDVTQAWGMTEMSPIGVAGTMSPALAAHGPDTALDILWSRQGRGVFGVQVKTAEDGSVLARGPWVIQRYYGHDKDCTDADGWFDTGDVGEFDSDGYLKITDRKKDVIKSGGEWIGSIDIENLVIGLPGVRLAAVVGVYHPKWEERPILIIEPHGDASVDLEGVRSHLSQHIAKWWMPDHIIIGPVPLTAIGKIDKKALRTQFRDILAPGVASPDAPVSGGA